MPVNDDDNKELIDICFDFNKRQISYIKNYWNKKQIEKQEEFRKSNKLELEVKNLYDKRKSSQYQRFSLRGIVQYDLDLFTTFFPIIFTTPDVCSNLFEGQNKYFVIFDEASQLKIEDTLPALLKGRQIIIAGDEHQMPPSNYFASNMGNEIDDDEGIDKDGILLGCKSLLEFVSECNFKTRYLDFHYRSKHSYLIEFSNYAFYEKRLIFLPNSSEDIPIKYI